MKEAILEVVNRDAGSKSVLSNFRKSGKIPAVFYGKNVKTSSITVDSKSLLAILAEGGANVIINLNFKDGKKPAIVKNIQRDILTQEPIHIDFQLISLKDKVEVKVPIYIEGIADGVKNFGGLMEFIEREVEVSCLPTNIPQRIKVDVSALGIGQGITVADLPKIEGVEYKQAPNTLIVHVVTIKVEEEKPAEPAAAAGTEVAQPEVISKGKKDKEGEEGAAAPAAPAPKK